MCIRLMHRRSSGLRAHFMSGKAMTSRMLGLSVSSITRRSMPMPMPAVGGMPYSSACTKSSSSTTCSKPKSQHIGMCVGGGREGGRSGRDACNIIEH
jgi:hypothetical protein